MKKDKQKQHPIKKSKESLKVNEERFRLLAENAQDIIYRIRLTPKLIIEYVSPSVTPITGYTQEEIYTNPEIGFKLVHPDDQDLLKRILYSGEHQKTPFILRVIHKEGKTVWIELHDVPIYDDGKLVAFEGIARDITMRKQMEEEIQKGEETLRHITDNLLDIVSEIDAEGKRLFVSPSYKTVLGYESEELLGKSIFDLIHPDDLKRSLTVFKKAATKHSIVRTEIRHRHADGHYIWLDIVGKPIIDHSGQFAGGIIAGRDITEQKNAEKALKETHDWLQTIIDTSPMAISALDSQNNILFWSSGAEKMFGWTSSEVIGQQLPSIPDSYHQLFHERREKVLAGKHHSGLRAQGKRKDGTLVDYAVWTAPMTDADGTMIGTLGVHIDITDLKKYESEAHELKQQIEFILGGTKTGLDIIDSHYNIRYIDPVWAKVYGDFTGKKCYEYFMDKNSPCPECGVQKAIKTKSAIIAEEILIKEGNRPVQVTTIPYQDEKGEWLVAEVNVDITERKRTEDALRESEEKFRSLAEASLFGIYAYREKFVYVNPAFVTMTGFTNDELLSMNYWELVHPDFRDLVRQRGTARLRGEKVPDHYKIKLVRKDGSEFWIEAAATVPQLGGKPIGIGICMEITERKRAEEQLSYQATLMANVRDAIVASDAQYRLTAWNAAAETLYGWKAEEVLGRYGLDITKTEFPGVDKKEMLMTIEKTGLWRGEVTQARKDGTRIPVEVASMILRDESGQITGYVSVNRDITERKRVEEQKNKQNQILTSITTGESLATILELIVRLVEEEDPEAICSILLLDNEGQHLLHGAAPNLPDFYNQAIHGLKIGDGVGSCGTAAYTKQRVVVEDILTHPYWTDFRELAQKANLRSCWSEPILSVSGAVLGTFAIYHREPRSLRSEDIEHIESLAHFASLAIERKRAEETLRESEIHFKALYQNNPIPTFTWKKEGDDFVLVDYNNPAKVITDGKVAEFIGRSAHEMYKDRPDIVQSLQQCLAENEIIIREKISEHFVPGRLIVVTFAPVPPDIVMVHLEDITEHKQAEEALQTSRAQMSNALEIAHLGHWEFDIATDLFTFNDHFYKIFQTTVEQVGGYTMSSAEYARRFVHPDDMQVVAEETRKAIETTDPDFNRQLEHRILYADGTVGYITVRFFIVKDAHGNTVKTYGVNQDITDRKQMEEALRESEESFRLTFENANIGISLMNLEGRLFRVNDKMCEIFGYSRIELEKMTVNDIAYPDDRNISPSFMKRAVSGEVENATFEKRYIHKQGHIINGKVSSSLVRDAKGSPLYFISHIEDITEHKKDEEKLRRNNDAQTVINSLLQLSIKNITLDEILQKALEIILSIPWLVFESRGAIFLVTDESQVLEMRVENGLAAPIKQSCLKIPFGRCHCGRAAMTQETQFASCVDERHDISYPGITPHGHYCTPIIYENKILGVMNIYLKNGHQQDNGEESFLKAITNALAGIIMYKKVEEEQKKLQVQLMQTQKLESVGRLAGGVAHDFNNILTAILGNTDLALVDMDSSNPLWEDLQEIKRLAKSAADLTHQLLAFSRKQVIEPKVINFNELIITMDKMLRRLIGEDIEIVTLPADNLWPVKVDPGQFEQLITNLAVNARDAMPNGGKLTIETANVSLDEDYIASHPYTTPSRYVMFAVSDSGMGMDKETVSKIFEPFFTTKPKEKGSGLGLSICYGIVKQNQGNIEVYSEPGHGTTFKVYLPALTGDAEKLSAKEEVIQKTLKGTETILVVEDNPAVKRMIIRTLKNSGYTTLEASEGKEALEKMKAYSHKVHLLITDVVMPEMGGKELSENMQLLSPDTKVLFMSGYTDDSIVHHGILEKGIEFIEKPFTHLELLQKVQKILTKESES